jgi:hypothetical protein
MLKKKKVFKADEIKNRIAYIFSSPPLLGRSQPLLPQNLATEGHQNGVHSCVIK